MTLDRLAELAAAATPGPWGRLYDYGASEPPDMRPGTYFLTNASSDDRHPIAQAVAGPDAAYIVAASPDTILRLIAVVRAAQEVVDAMDVGPTDNTTAEWYRWQQRTNRADDALRAALLEVDDDHR